MALDQDKILKNTSKYFTTAESKGFMTTELMEFLGQDFINAPASCKTEQFNAFPGGLIAHILMVTKYAVSFNDALPELERVNKDSLIKVCFLHQIGKAKMFIPRNSQWHLEKGIMYDFATQEIAMRVSERSIYYANTHGVKLTEEETSAILMSDKSDDKMVDFRNSTLGDLLRIGNTFAIKNERITV